MPILVAGCREWDGLGEDMKPTLDDLRASGLAQADAEHNCGWHFLDRRRSAVHHHVPTAHPEWCGLGAEGAKRPVPEHEGH